MRSLVSRICALTCAVPISIAVVATAQAEAYREPGFYVGLSGGAQSRSPSAESEYIWTRWEDGTVFSALAGYRVNQHFRIDGEFTRFNNDADTLNGGLLPDGVTQLIAPASGSAELDGWFINGTLDFEPHPRWTLSLGLGFGQMTSDVHNLTNSTISQFGFVFDGESEDWVNAWQFKTDLSYGVTDNLQVFLQYRHVDADQFNFVFHPPNGLTFHAGPKETIYDTGEIGLRYSF